MTLLLDWQLVGIVRLLPDEAAVLANLQRQLEAHDDAKLNGVPLTDTEFKSALNHLGLWRGV